MHPGPIVAFALIAATYVGGMAAIGHGRAEADSRAQATQECRDVATAKYTTGEIEGVDGYELALDACDELR